jgi:hypothetical protein
LVDIGIKSLVDIQISLDNKWIAIAEANLIKYFRVTNFEEKDKKNRKEYEWKLDQDIQSILFGYMENDEDFTIAYKGNKFIKFFYVNSKNERTEKYSLCY